MISDELILAGKLQLKKLQKKKPEKNSGFDGAWTRASQIKVGRSTNWATKPHVGSEAISLMGAVFPVKEDKSYYEINLIRPAGDKWRIDPRRYTAIKEIAEKEAWKKTPSTGKNPCLPLKVGRSTNWATKPHVGSEANF